MSKKCLPGGGRAAKGVVWVRQDRRMGDSAIVVGGYTPLELRLVFVTLYDRFAMRYQPLICDKFENEYSKHGNKNIDIKPTTKRG